MEIIIIHRPFNKYHYIIVLHMYSATTKHYYKISSIVGGGRTRCRTSLDASVGRLYQTGGGFHFTVKNITKILHIVHMDSDVVDRADHILGQKSISYAIY